MKKLFFFINLFMISVNVLMAEENPLSFNGDVKLRSISSWEEKYEHRLTCEATLGLDYDRGNNWFNSKFKVTTPFQCACENKVNLQVEQLSVGFLPYEDDTNQFYFEVGRHRLDYLFESKIQFKKHFNGVHLCYNRIDEIGNITIHGGPLVMDSLSNHFGFIAETSIRDILNSGIDLTYNLVDWMESSKDYYESYFLISQVLATYRFNDCAIYGAYLKNHRATIESDGFYAGVSYGQIVQARDFMLDVNYQYLDVFCVPVFDQEGIGTGFLFKGIYAITENFHVKGKVATTKFAELSLVYKW